MSDEPAFYDRALRRIDRVAIAFALVFVIGVLAVRGWREAMGCAIGALLSFVNLWMWRRAANAVRPDADRTAASSAALFGLRYLLLGGIIFVIIKYLEVSFAAVFAGLLVSVAAVIVEIVYELIFTSHKT